LRFGKVTDNLKMGTFFDTQLTIQLTSLFEINVLLHTVKHLPNFSVIYSWTVCTQIRMIKKICSEQMNAKVYIIF